MSPTTTLSSNSPLDFTTEISKSNIAARAAIVVFKSIQRRRRRRRYIPRSIGTFTRHRVSVLDIFRQCGPALFRRAYRMSYALFCKLSKMLRKNMLLAMERDPLGETNFHYIPNGPISISVRLACALRYFAGGSPLDLMTTFQIGFRSVLYSVWFVVQAIHNLRELDIAYPTSHAEQQTIAEGFKNVSAAQFDCCAGAIDGVLIWIQKPSDKECASAGVGASKIFCGRKHKFGLNCQAICDVQGRFLDLSIMFPGSTSDCLAFEGMAIYEKLERGLLAPGLCLFGDNAYINCIFMATPYSGVSGGSKDAYNFYQSQVRIRIECAFGILTHRWAILRKALPQNMSISKSVSLVLALAKLHNFCITEKENEVPAALAIDELGVVMEGAVPLETQRQVPLQLLGGGEHFDDVDRNTRRQRLRQSTLESRALNLLLPRERLHNIIADANLTRPSTTPTSTNN